MEIRYDTELIQYMERKKKKDLIVEVVSSEHSDFDVTELHPFLADEKTAAFYISSKKYKAIDTDRGRVLFPPYKLEYDPVIHFGLKSFWIIHMVSCKGIRL